MYTSTLSRGLCDMSETVPTIVPLPAAVTVIGQGAIIWPVTWASIRPATEEARISASSGFRKPNTGKPRGVLCAQNCIHLRADRPIPYYGAGDPRTCT